MCIKGEHFSCTRVSIRRYTSTHEFEVYANGSEDRSIVFAQSESDILTQ